jgi:hypothetical protein
MHEFEKHASSRVGAAMEQLTLRVVNRNKSGGKRRIAEKILHSMKCCRFPGQNIMKINELGAGLDDLPTDRVEMAMSAVRASTRHSSFGFSQIVAEAMDAEASKTDEGRKQRLARARWHWAHDMVRCALKYLADQEEEGDGKGELVIEGRKSLQEKLETEKLGEVIKHDTASLGEVFQMAINFSRASYTVMFEERSLRAEAFEVLMDSLHAQEEALSNVLKDVRQHRVKATDNHGHLDEQNRKLEHQQLTGMLKSLEAGWQHIKNSMGKASLGDPLHLALNLFRIDCTTWLQASWHLMKRDTETILAYILTQDHILDELDILSSFQGVDHAMEKLLKDAKKNGLLDLARAPHDEGMLFAFEHILFARLILRIQNHLIQEYAGQGMLTHHDSIHLQQHIMKPADFAIRSWCPSCEQLKRLGTPEERLGQYRDSGIRRFLWKVVAVAGGQTEELGDGH